MLEKLKNLKKENLYLIIALTIGIFMVFFNPPFAGVPDEGAHYFKLLSVANGYLRCSGQSIVSKDAANLPDEIKPVKIEGVGERMSLGKIKKAFLEKDSGETQVINNSGCSFIPVAFVASAIGTDIGRILHLSPLANFYLSRLFNLLVAVFIIYWAIKIIPFGKTILFLIALLPMTVQQLSSVSYDSLHISSILLFIAYVLKLAYGNKNKITRKEVIWLIILSLVALNTKPGYILLSGLIFLLPINKFANKKEYWVNIAFFILLNLGAVLLAQNFFAGGSSDFRNGVNPSSQLSLILHAPWHFVWVIINSLYKDFFFYFETTLFKPGWLDHSLPVLWYIFMLLGLIVIIRNEDEDVLLTKKQRVVMFVIFLANLSVVFLGLYLLWSKVGGDKVQGVQGRYFLSTLPLLLLVFYKSNFSLKFESIKKNRNLAVIVFMIIVFFFAIQSLYGMYYDKTGAGNKYAYDKFLTREQVRTAETIEANKNFQQTFRATKDNLIGVKVYIPKEFVEGQAIDFYLKDENCSNIIRKKSVVQEGSEISSFNVTFAMVLKSKNKNYCLSANITSGKSLKISLSPVEYADGALTLDDVAQSKDLAFYITYKN